MKSDQQVQARHLSSPVVVSCPLPGGQSDAAIEAAAAADHELPHGSALEDRSWTRRAVSLVAIIMPLAGLIVAMILMWGEGAVGAGFGWLLATLLGVGYLLSTIGICVGYHRLFTHKSFETGPVVKAILGILGSMAVEGSILHWVATHRRHHQHSDRPDDPHSPHNHGVTSGVGRTLWSRIRGFGHAHIGWFFTPDSADLQKYVPDLKADKVTRRVSDLFSLWVAIGLLAPAAIAFAVTGTWMGALLGFLWGGLVRVFLVHHITWSINSVCHLWGSRPFDSHDHSRNNVLFGILAFGEGWHNNHHAFPTSARHGLRWWEFDLSYWIIRGLEAFGLARAVRVPSPERIEAKRRRR
jgi:stearoyl-CoA desaturase (delta-9 desaturase)